jgi:hypothetical protein
LNIYKETKERKFDGRNRINFNEKISKIFNKQKTSHASDQNIIEISKSNQYIYNDYIIFLLVGKTMKANLDSISDDSENEKGNFLNETTQNTIIRDEENKVE